MKKREEEKVQISITDKDLKFLAVGGSTDDLLNEGIEDVDEDGELK